MRRTYRSKKDTGGALDHRDVLLNMDEKSSAFEAFYIQNIKQTKRELSCVGSSNAYGVASKKVRKRKYVKRIVKEVENLKPRESMSTSTYLTPDKSIRVNKILDPFDALLNSSSNGQVTAEINKNEVFDKLLPKKEGKTYIRKKLTRARKFNYSSDLSSDSDKENTSNTQSNMTDIGTHKLLVEREPSNSPIYFDESINKIVNNLSLINNYKRKPNSSFNTSYKHHLKRLTKNCQSPVLQKSPLCSTPFKDKYRGKSIYNFSPISTKERGSNYVTIVEDTNESNNSIVFLCKEKVPKLSKKHTSPLIGIAVEDNLPQKLNSKSLIYEDEIDLQILQTDGCEKNYLKSRTNDKNSKSTSTEESLLQISEAEPFLGFSDDKITESIIDQKNYLIKCIQEHNPENEKLNASEDVNIDDIANDNRGRERLLDDFPIEVSNFNESQNKTDIDRLEIPSEQDVNLSQDDDMHDRDTSLEHSSDEDFYPSDESYSGNNNSDEDKSAEKQSTSIISKETTICDSSNSSQMSDKASMYDTCESEQSFEDDKVSSINKGIKEPKVNIERLNNSVLAKYHENLLTDKGLSFEGKQSFTDEKNSSLSKGIKKPKIAIERLNDSVFIKYHEKMVINKDQRPSGSFSEKENNGLNEPKVAIEKLNDSVFIKYYEKMRADEEDSSFDSNKTNENLSDADETTSDINESQSVVYETQSEVENRTETDEVNNSFDNNSSTSFNNYSRNNISDTVNTESDSLEAQANEIVITDSSTTEDVESNDEVSNDEDERHVSFVTTRRRNEITNDSMFIFDNSYGSSSTDCDKTVLSNKARLSYFEKSDVEIDDSTNKARISDTNDVATCEDKTQEKTNKIHRSTTDTRTSGFTRNSEVTDMDSSINEVTIIGTGQDDNDETKNDASPSRTENNTESRSSVITKQGSKVFRGGSIPDRFSEIDTEERPSRIVLQPGKKWERSLSIYRRMTTMADHFDQSLLEDEAQKKGRKYRQSVISTMEMQDSLHNESINSRRSTFISKPSRTTIRFVKDSNSSRISLNTTEVFDDLKGFLTEECDDTVIELSKLSLADSEFEVTVLDNFHDSSDRVTTARDYVLRRCNQTDPILFDECYPETVLKNCHKIGEGVYGEVFLWRGRDGRARVMKIVPIAGTCKVNGEQQKDFHEVISELVIAMELSALRAPIADIDRYFDEGKDLENLDLHAVENATDVFNEVLAVRCVQGPYPSRLLDLWELFDECKGSENDNPAALPADQQYMVLELANAGQDLESYQFTGAQQAHALFQQIAFGIAVGEESFQFEHRDLHWGNVLIAPTEQKWAWFVLRGRTHRVARGGVAATVIDYSLSRIALPLGAARACPPRAAPRPGPPERASLYNDLAADDQLFDAVGDYQFEVYRLMRQKLGNEWKNYEPYTNILWLHYTVDKMITALRYKRPTTKIHKHYIEKLKGIKERILDYKSATEYVLTDIEI